MRLMLAIVLVIAAGCGGTSATDSGPRGTVAVQVFAGPTCPVETVGDPDCAPRRVKQAKLVVETPTGEEVTSLDVADGAARTELPPGRYVLVPQRAEGLMGTAPPVTFQVREGQTTTVKILYDTGIR